ncbi:HAD hydrolase family protein [Mycoplasmopsis cynos]|nr:HAD hydrolase family protein [Mycoplasmopsis cynos]UWV80829.1 HAD hydrolase family protein [Mycoplasmopsis cynos]WAM05543.1 HAD hydrolase family protein [Mycoplasmopsis cynos]
MDKINKINDKYLDSIFFDLDGTLLNSQKQITEKTLLCIKKLQAKGKKLESSQEDHTFLLNMKII